MLEQFANYFYDPFVFWAAPLALAALIAAARRVRVWKRRRH